MDIQELLNNFNNLISIADLSKYENLVKLQQIAINYDKEIHNSYGDCLKIAFKETDIKVNQTIDPPSCYRGLIRPVKITYVGTFTIELSDPNANSYIEDCIMTGTIPDILPDIN